MKLTHRIIFLSFLFILPGLTVLAQPLLTLEQAVEQALQNHYDIKLSNNQVEIARTNVSRANAGMLPVVTGNLSTNNNTSNTTQTLSSGQTQTRDGAKNTSLNYGPSLNWRLFDGFEMFARYDQLKELQKLGEAAFRLTVQTTISDVINTYYTLVKQQEDIEASQIALSISQMRLTNARNRYSIGKAAKLEVLQATVDLNTDTTTLIRQQDLYKSNKIFLNELLARDIREDFTVSDTILIDQGLVLSQIMNTATQQNPALQSAVINQRVAELNLKQVKANRYPDISFNTGYNFSRSTSELGFARESNGRGFSYGITASINIFNGFLQKRNERNAAVLIDNSKLEYDKLAKNIDSQISTLYQNYQTALTLIRLEQQNVGVAKQNLDITLEKFRFGTLIPLEFREAQRNYIDAIARLSNAQYEAKLAEVSLKEISGTLNLQ